MNVLAIDPSSTCTGYAVFADGKLVDAGLYKPSKSGLDAIQRISDMLDDFRAMLGKVDYDAVVIEIPIGRQHTQTPGKKSGFAIWGLACGAFWATARAWPTCRTFPVSNTIWTRGKSKADRQLAASLMYKGYDSSQDKGGDVSDAVCLGHWWLNQQTPKGLFCVRALQDSELGYYINIRSKR